MNFEELKQEKHKEVYEKIVCYNCKEEIKEGSVYYFVDGAELCEVCLNDCKRYA